MSFSFSSDPSGAVFYPDYFRKHFTFNDLTIQDQLTAVRIEGSIYLLIIELKN